ncbi:MAG TPA: hypothetical protein VMA36_05460 [Candidatus Limnocylindria bacterium]|jgi:hypothetical protein|nr:hypothetical protein [Candidatus Limnocylindria bacterium]
MQIRLAEPVATAAPLVGPVLVQRLDAYAAASPSERLALEGLRVRVPIVLDVLERLGVPADGARVRIAAAHETALFPVFAGTIRAAAVDALSCELILEGDCTAPLGPLGLLADHTVLADVASDSLRRFLARLKAEVAAATLRRELGI